MVLFLTGIILSRTVRCRICNELVEDIVKHKEFVHKNRRKSNKVRTCPICNYRGHQLIGFIYHMMKEHNDTSFGTVEIYKCDDCDFQSCYPWTVQKHTMRVHGKEKEFEQGIAAHQLAVEQLGKCRTVRCKYCDEVVDDIVAHKAEIHGDIREKTKVRICPTCGYRGHQLTTFIYHMMVEHNDLSFGTVDVYKCSYCDFQSCFEGTVKRHTKDKHDSIKVKEEQSGKSDLTVESQTPVTLKVRGSLGVHQKCRTVRCKYCDEVVDDIVAHKAEMHGDIKERTRVRVCPTCGYRGHQLTTFIYHMMVEHNDTSHGTVDIFRCSYCDFQSCFQGAIQKHAKDVHGEVDVKTENLEELDDKDGSQTTKKPLTKPRISQCKICGHVSNNITEHRRLVHGYPKKIKRARPKLTKPKTVCEICGLAVLDVRAHVLRIHSDTKPVPKIFVCPTCGWTTKDTTHFKFHMMTKHNDFSHGTVKIHKCDHCNYQHFYIGTIVKHIRLVHERRRDYQCDICGHSVTTKSTLAQHKLSHSEEGRSSLKCPHCTYTTCWKGPLQRHIRVRHTVSTFRWPCRLCSTTFKDKDILKVHLKKKHQFSYEETAAFVKSTEDEIREQRLIEKNETSA